MNALRSLAWKIFIRCPKGAGEAGLVSRGLKDEVWVRGGSVYEITVYDLLGRRLCSLEPGHQPLSEASVLAFVRHRADLPPGPKLVRVRTESEVHTWRLAP
jgi:hypothetical protein